MIRTRKLVAQECTEPIATGEFLEGSTLGDSPFCAGVDHPAFPYGSSDPTVWLIIETITCPDGTRESCASSLTRRRA